MSILTEKDRAKAEGKSMEEYAAPLPHIVNCELQTLSKKAKYHYCEEDISQNQKLAD